MMANDPDLKTLDNALKVAMRDNYKFGLIRALQHTPEQGNQERIRIYPVGDPCCLAIPSVSFVTCRIV